MYVSLNKAFLWTTKRILLSHTHTHFYIYIYIYIYNYILVNYSCLTWFISLRASSYRVVIVSGDCSRFARV